MAAVAWPYILLRKALANCDSVLRDRYAASMRHRVTTERTGDRKAKDVPGTAVFERIEDEHGRYREQPEGREQVHV